VLGRFGCEDHDSVVGSEGSPGAMHLDARCWTFLDVLQFVGDGVYSLSLSLDQTDISLLWQIFSLSSVPIFRLGPCLFVRDEGLTLSPYNLNLFSWSFWKSGSKSQSISA